LFSLSGNLAEDNPLLRDFAEVPSLQNNIEKLLVRNDNDQQRAAENFCQGLAECRIRRIRF